MPTKVPSETSSDTLLSIRPLIGVAEVDTFKANLAPKRRHRNVGGLQVGLLGGLIHHIRCQGEISGLDL